MDWKKSGITILVFFLVFIPTIKHSFGCGVTASVDDSTPCVNQQVTFTATYDQTKNAVWDFGANAVPATGSGTQVSGVYYTSAGTKTVTCTAYGNTTGNTYTDQLTITVVALPSDPGTITSNSPRCAGAGVTFTQGTCPSGSTCYWVSSAMGTETTNSAATYTTATTAGTYTVWVRAKDNTTGCWSTAVTASGTVNSLPSAPGTITSNAPQCAGTSVTFTKGSCPSGSTCYWVSSASGTETTNSAATYTTATTADTYTVWVRAKDNTTGCWSTAVTASGTVNPLPAAPGAITSNSPQCAGTSVTFTKGSCPSGSTCYWVSSATGTEITNSASTYTTATTAGAYNVWVRAKDNTSGCWSTAVTLSGTVNALPSATVDGHVDVACNGGTGSITISGSNGTAPYQFSLDNGETYTTGTNPNPYTFTGKPAGTYYPRVRDSNNCQSAFCQP